ncbi:MAG: hypothetical protein JWP37_1258 [Mucilaginibacter sp.]|nr:hypothetical protein [Mucilaginibacter sp.]
MKIRIKGNSLRYRLTKSDVNRFAEEGYLQEVTNFGTQSLIYALERSAADDLEATFQDNKITLYMPEKMTYEWSTDEKVGFECNKGDFYLLIEKDFKCLDNVAEDQSDNYPNPLSAFI